MASPVSGITSGSTSQPLNPEMVHRAITPSSPISSPPDAFLRDDDDEKPVKLSFHIIMSLRVVIFALLLAAFITSVDQRMSGFHIPLDVFMVFTITWNVFAFANAFRNAPPRGKFRFHIVIGGFEWGCGGHEDYRSLDGDDGEEPRPRPRKPLVTREGIADLVFGFYLLIFGIIAKVVEDPYWVYDEERAVYGLVFTSVGLQFAMAILSTSRYSRWITLLVRPNEDNWHGEHHYIRLPRNSVETQGTTSKGFSVHA